MGRGPRVQAAGCKQAGRPCNAPHEPTLGGAGKLPRRLRPGAEARGGRGRQQARLPAETFPARAPARRSSGAPGNSPAGPHERDLQKNSATISALPRRVMPCSRVSCRAMAQALRGARVLAPGPLPTHRHGRRRRRSTCPPPVSKSNVGRRARAHARRAARPRPVSRSPAPRRARGRRRRRWAWPGAGAAGGRGLAIQVVWARTV